MNTLKRFIALILCLAVVVLCFTGCHTKGELAVTVDNVKFTSGDYACALLFADLEAREYIYDKIEAEEITLASEKELYNQKIDNVEYVKWVENTALDNLKMIAATMALCDKANLSIDSDNQDAKDLKEVVKETADSVWSTAEFAELMEENGIAKETFIKYSYYTGIFNPLFLELLYGEGNAYKFTNPLFNSIYGKDGEKELTTEELKKQLSENYILVNRLTVDFEGLTDDQKKEAKDRFTAYETSLKDGSKTFEKIYLEENKTTEKDHHHEEPAEGEDAPKDYHAVPISEESTYIGYGSDYYSVVKKMEMGEVKVIELDEKAGLTLVIKKDILEDPYYLKACDAELREEIKGEEFVNDIKAAANKLSCNVNTKSTKQFDVKKVHYPEVTTEY